MTTDPRYTPAANPAGLAETTRAKSPDPEGMLTVSHCPPFSVAACAVVSALFVVTVHAGGGRGDQLFHDIVDVSGAWTLVFAAVCATVMVPVFLMMRSAGFAMDRRWVHMTLGACLACTSLFAFAMVFREHEDPKTVTESIDWLINRPQMLWGVAIGTLPYLVSGLVFGYSWAAELRNEREARA
jgi:hypothetical protein